LPFQARGAELRGLRKTLRAGVRQLVAAPGEVLHARFVGPRPQGADVEHTLLSAVDEGGGAFASAAAEGVRFEASASPGRPTGCEFVYALVPRANGFFHWFPGEPAASWSGVELDGIDPERVWLAL